METWKGIAVMVYCFAVYSGTEADDTCEYEILITNPLGERDGDDGHDSPGFPGPGGLFNSQRPQQRQQQQQQQKQDSLEDLTAKGFITCEYGCCGTLQGQKCCGVPQPDKTHHKTLVATGVVMIGVGAVIVISVIVLCVVRRVKKTARTVGTAGQDKSKNKKSKSPRKANSYNMDPNDLLPVYFYKDTVTLPPVDGPQGASPPQIYSRKITSPPPPYILVAPGTSERTSHQ